MQYGRVAILKWVIKESTTEEELLSKKGCAGVERRVRLIPV